jgi:hypothetical protein
MIAPNRISGKTISAVDRRNMGKSGYIRKSSNHYNSEESHQLPGKVIAMQKHMRLEIAAVKAAGLKLGKSFVFEKDQLAYAAKIEACLVKAGLK